MMADRRKDPIEDSLDALLDEVTSLTRDRKTADLPPPEPIDGTFSVNISEDRLTVHVDIFPPALGGKPCTFVAIREALVERGIVAILEEEIATAVVRVANGGEAELGLLVAQGIPPRMPKEPMLQILFALERTHLQVDETADRVDYRDQGEVLSVEPGVLLALLDPAVPGEPGVNVFGMEIAVPHVRDVALRAGPGVERRGNGFFSTEKGQPALRNGELTVKPIHVVAGDVSYESGNIVFEGSVQVKGNVRQGFTVEAGFDVEINGNVDSALIAAGRNISILGGVFGEKSMVEARGDVTVRFVENGTLLADGNVVIRSHALHSVVRACGSVTVEGRKGILGGEVYAKYLIDTMGAGSPMGTRTRLNAGNDFRAQMELENYDREIAKTKETAMRVSGVIKEVSQKFTVNGRVQIPKEIVGKLEALIGRYNETVADLNRLTDERIALFHKIEGENRTLGRIRVRQVVHPGVVIELRSLRREIKDELRFAAFSIDPDKGEIVLGSYR